MLTRCQRQTLCGYVGSSATCFLARDEIMSATSTEGQRMAKAGYARIVIGSMIHPQLNKRFLKRPYLKYGQCPALWGYLFELGGILVGKHASQLWAFGSAFGGGYAKEMGYQDSGAIKLSCADTANKLVARQLVNGSMTFFEYVQAAYVDQFPVYKGDTLRFFLEHGMDKIRPQIVAEVAWTFPLQGVALGAIYPELVRAMFERTYTARPKEEWERAYAAGLDIGPEQPRTSYKEAEETEDRCFMTYCRDCYPDLYSIYARRGCAANTRPCRCQNTNKT